MRIVRRVELSIDKWSSMQPILTPKFSSVSEISGASLEEDGRAIP